MNNKCLDCGKMFERMTNAQKYCPVCGAKKRRQQNLEANRRYRQRYSAAISAGLSAKERRALAAVEPEGIVVALKELLKPMGAEFYGYE